MSFDVQLAHPCPHIMVEEQITLLSDRQTMVLSSPIASSKAIRILANDTDYIPSGGLFSSASLQGDRVGPFRITECDTDFTVTTSTETIEISLPVGRLNVETLARNLLLASQDLSVEVIEGRLLLTDVANVGPTSRILVSGGAAAVVGFAHQRGARGRQIYPGWQFRSDNGQRSLRFDQPLRSNPLLKATYTTYPAQCRRCQGTYIENDQRFDLTGETLIVRDDNLLYQAAFKIVLTQIRSNPFHPQYGSGLMSRVGSKAVAGTASLLTEDVTTALAKLVQLQGKQAQYQQVSPKERLYSVRSVRVIPKPDDPTVYLVDIVVSNASGDPVEITIVFSVPGVIALTGSNGLSLGLEPTGLVGV